ncbi:hypothetical protein BDW69DRAFT_168915 [Aspergillus filifer]
MLRWEGWCWFSHAALFLGLRGMKEAGFATRVDGLLGFVALFDYYRFEGYTLYQFVVLPSTWLGILLPVGNADEFWGMERCPGFLNHHSSFLRAQLDFLFASVLPC